MSNRKGKGNRVVLLEEASYRELQDSELALRCTSLNTCPVIDGIKLRLPAIYKGSLSISDLIPMPLEVEEDTLTDEQRITASVFNAAGLGSHYSRDYSDPQQIEEALAVRGMHIFSRTYR
jgi:hypothetical protein